MTRPCFEETGFFELILIDSKSGYLLRNNSGEGFLLWLPVYFIALKNLVCIKKA